MAPHTKQSTNVSPLQEPHQASATTLWELSVRASRLGFPKQKKYSPNSLFVFAEVNWLRSWAIYIVGSTPFEICILLTIIANCVVLALDSRDNAVYNPRLSGFVNDTEPYFVGLFTVEAAFKIVAFGFAFHQDAYMRSFWNVMDFTVVITGFIMVIAQVDELSFLRAFRVLRPLKLAYGIPSLHVVLKSIAKAMKPLLQIALLVLFAMIIFAIIGMEFYSGIFHSTCFSNTNNTILGSGKPCSQNPPVIPDQTNPNKCPALVTAYIACPMNYTCRQYVVGPNYGITNFDNFGFAMLAVFQILTKEGWTDIMYATDEVNGNLFNWIYFVPLIILGALFMLNLVLGVLSGQFAKERERIDKKSKFMKMRAKQQRNTELENYMLWIQNAEEALLQEDCLSEEEKMKVLKGHLHARRKYMRATGKKEEDMPPDPTLAYEEVQVLEQQKKRKSSSKTEAWYWQHEKILRYSLRRLVKSQPFFWFIIITVFLNTICVSLQYYGQPDWMTNFLFLADNFFLSVFMVEMFLKVYALSPRMYFRSTFNIFDMIVIALSLFEIIYTRFDNDADFGFSVLRALRLLRIFKVTKYWRSLRNLVLSLMNSIRSILSLLLLLFLFILIFALLGMNLFGGRYDTVNDGKKPYQNFDSIVKALITVFQVIAGPDWNVRMYQGIRSRMAYDGDFLPTFYSIYFVLLVVLGTYTLLNVFLAIAVDNLTSAEELTMMEAEQDLEDEERLERLKFHFGQNWFKGFGDPIKPIPLSLEMPVMETEFDLEEQPEPVEPKPVTNFDFANMQRECGIDPAKDSEVKESTMLPYSSLFIFTPDNIVRRFCHFIVNLRFFELFIMLVVAASSIALASADPVCDKNIINTLLDKLDYGFTAVFVLELLLKVVDQGLLLHPGSYLRSFWNIMDAFVVTCSIAVIIMSLTSSSNIDNLRTTKTLRVLRVLRPLRTINRIPKLKAVFDCVVESVKNVLNILLVYWLFQYMFAVIAVQLFSGKFFYCNDPTKMTKAQCTGQFMDDKNATFDREWRIRCFSYDNVFNSLLALFVVTAGDGWPDILEWSIAVTGVNKGPIPESRYSLAIFYVVFFILFPFFFVNIFVALTIITFQSQGESDLHSMNLNKNQKNCIDYVISAEPNFVFIPKKTSGLRYRVWRLVTSNAYENFIMSMIILNTILLTMKVYIYIPNNDFSAEVMQRRQQYISYSSSLSYINIGFTLLFTLECLLKLIGLGFKNYFSNLWNIIDFITVIGSIIDATITLIPTVNAPTSVLRLFRALRIIKLLRKNKSISTLLWTFVQSVKSLPYVLLLFVMLYFMYAVVAMQVFGNIQWVDDNPINRHANFQTFASAFLLLFRCSTGESWQQVMLACTDGQPCADGGSVDTTNQQRCGSVFAYPFFVSFVLLCTFLMLNLFVAVIMDNFEYLTSDASVLGSHHLEDFLQGWQQYDPQASGKIHHSDVQQLLRQLDPPLGFGQNCLSQLATRKLIRMNMPLDENGCVHFTTTLFTLIREALLIRRDRTIEMDTKDEELRALIKKLWPNVKEDLLNLMVPPNFGRDTPHLTLGQLLVGKQIAENWFSFKNHQTEATLSEMTSLDTKQPPNLKSIKSDESNDVSMDEVTSLGSNGLQKEPRNRFNYLQPSVWNRFEEPSGFSGPPPVNAGGQTRSDYLSSEMYSRLLEKIHGIDGKDANV